MQARKKDGLMSAANYQSGDGVTLDADPAPGGVTSINKLTALAIAAETTPAQGVVKVRHLFCYVNKIPSYSTYPRSRNHLEYFKSTLVCNADICYLEEQSHRRMTKAEYRETRIWYGSIASKGSTIS